MIALSNYESLFNWTWEFVDPTYYIDYYDWFEAANNHFISNERLPLIEILGNEEPKFHALYDELFKEEEPSFTEEILDSIQSRINQITKWFRSL